jgi:hypothetical protein
MDTGIPKHHLIVISPTNSERSGPDSWANSILGVEDRGYDQMARRSSKTIGQEHWHYLTNVLINYIRRSDAILIWTLLDVAKLLLDARITASGSLKMAR